MMLSDGAIKSYRQRQKPLVTGLDYPDGAAIQPASVDLRLDGMLRIYKADLTDFVIDARLDQSHAWDTVDMNRDGAHILPPGGFVLGATIEHIYVPDQLCGFVQGRSGIARLAVQIEAAGLLDPGWSGCPTLEIVNLAPYPVVLFIGMPIGQVYFLTLDAPSVSPYGTHRGSKYDGDMLPGPSRMWMNL